jgi:hypothetical protein
MASLALTVPAFKDQIYRLNRERENRKAIGSPWPGLRAMLAAAWERRRHDYDGSDSFFLATGGIGLVVAFLVKSLGF